MKSILYLLAATLLLISPGCKKNSDELPESLVTAKAQVEEAFAALDAKMEAAVSYLVSVNIDTVEIRSKLKELMASTTNVSEFCYVTPDGILSMIEPEEYYYSQGIDISQQDHIVKSYASKKIVLSKIFQVVEGYFATAYIHPIIQNNVIKGGLVAVIIPEYFLGEIIRPLLVNADFELWAMESGGRIIFDQDAEEVGLYLFTDPLYQEFPELLEAGRKIDDLESGTTTYSFYKTGTTEKVTKLTYWNTVDIHEMQWKMVWVKAQ
jgi:hypothetical protein